MTSNWSIIRDVKDARNNMYEKRKLYIESKEILEELKRILEEVKQEAIEKNKLNDILNSLLLFNVNSIIIPKLDKKILNKAIDSLEELNSNAKSFIRLVSDAEQNVQKQEKACKTALYDCNIAIEYYIYNYKRFMNKYEQIKSEYNDVLLLQDTVHRNTIYESTYANNMYDIILRKVEYYRELINEMTDTCNIIKYDLHDLMNDSIINELNNDVYNRIRNNIEITVTDNNTHNIYDINDNVNNNINIINDNVNNNINIINDNINNVINNDINTLKENIRIRNTTEANTHDDSINSINSNVTQNNIDERIINICNDLNNNRKHTFYEYVTEINKKNKTQ